ncbi:MAG TPA: PAS domain S-box protein [Burkholderiaceae bacterium]
MSAAQARADAGATSGGLTIRARILLLAMAVLLPAAVALAWRLAQELQQSREDALNTVTLLRDNSTRHLSWVIRHASALLDFVAQHAHVRDRDAASCQAAVRGVPLLQPGFMRLEMQDSSGRFLCWSSAVRPPAAYQPPQDGPSTGLSVGPARMDPATGRLAVPMWRRVVDDTGAVQGRLLLMLDLGGMGEELSRNIAAGAVVTVVDPQANILMRTQYAQAFMGERGTVQDHAAGHASGLVDAAGRDGIDRLFASGTVPEAGWRVFAGLPRSHVYAAYEQTRLRTIVLGSMVLALACVMAWQLASVIARPIASLQAAARRVGSGDLGHVAVEGPPELRGVAEEFNRMVDALSLSRSRLQALFDTMSEAVITVDNAQTVVMANPAAAALLRCPVSVLIGSKLDRWIPERARSAHRRDVERFGESGSLPRDMGRRPEISALRFDGEETPIEASISVAEVEGRRFYTAVLRDVGERRRTMTALAQGKALLAAALSNMSDAVAILDAQGRFIAVNDAFATFYRLTPDRPPLANVQELASLLDIRFADGRPAGPDECAGLRAIAGQSGTNVLYELRRVDGGETWTGSFNFAPIRDAAGAITGAVSTARDVTAQLAAQHDLEHSRDALRRLVGSLDRSLDDERRRISRELHDDLQQTLAAIGMEASTAVRLAPPPVAAIRETLQRIESLSHNALRSTRRIIADLRPQLLEELGLAAALCNMADVHARRYRMACDVEVDDDFDAKALPELVATCLYRVAQEALHNVAKHAGASHVRIRLRLVDGHVVHLEIRDDGRGIERDAEAKPRGFGLLGMSERVHALAGTLLVYSEPGDGTVVDAELPLDLGVANPAAAGTPGSDRSRDEVRGPVDGAQPAPASGS